VLKPHERKAEFEPLKNCGVHEEEGLDRVHPIIRTYKDSPLARKDLQVRVKLLPEDMKFVLRFALFVLIYVLMGVQLRSLSQKGFKGPVVKGFVVNGGRRVWFRFRSGHLVESLKRKEKGRKQGFRRRRRRDLENLEKYSREA